MAGTADYFADGLESARLDIRTSEAAWRKTQRQCAAHFASRLDAVQTKKTRAALRAQVASTVSSVNEMAHDMTLLHRAFVDLEVTGREMGDEAMRRRGDGRWRWAAGLAGSQFGPGSNATMNGDVSAAVEVMCEGDRLCHAGMDSHTLNT